ncbi:type II CAAX endopeptidase family protein [Mycoplasmatota bacterium WC30]
MNEFDDLFEKKPEKEQQYNENNDIENFYRQAGNQRKNGLLLTIYVLVSLVFSFASGVIFNLQYPDSDSILANIVVISDPVIEVNDNSDEEYPYIISMTGTLQNNTEYDLPNMWVDFEFFDEDEVSYGVYTISEEGVLIGDPFTLNESIETDFNPDTYTVTYGFDASANFYTALSLIPVMISAALFLLIDKESFKSDLSKFKLDIRKHVGQIFSGFFMVYAALLVSNLLLTLLGETGTSQNEMAIQNLFSDDPIQLVMLFLLLCVFTPVVEEVIFRKVIYNFFEPKTSHVVAIIATGVIFGLMHVIAYGDFIQSIPYIMMGMTFGYIYYRSNKNIFVTIGVHFANNLLSFVLYILMVYGIYI